MVKRDKRGNSNRTISYAIEGESIYGQVERPLGNARFEIICSDGVIRICKVRGSLHKRVWIQQNDIVLVSFREGDPNKGDIILKYFPQEVKILRDNKQIPDDFTASMEIPANVEFDSI
ncbi:Eukaryotic translation initiation factor 1A [Astathelohania contejeani]|uniref:Eukaryotic translation initiation factor 1A n=1 Tax=Astathelohania contejeani TaxID=164912 RepID=A0ABQ7I244_9MICR|nr:Eukaryotic translation initiation factor 1A [Thelohania contejeani]